MQLPFPLAEAPDDATLENARKLFAGQSEFVKGVVAMSGLRRSTSRPSARAALRTSRKE